MPLHLYTLSGVLNNYETGCYYPEARGIHRKGIGSGCGARANSYPDNACKTVQKAHGVTTCLLCPLLECLQEGGTD